MDLSPSRIGSLKHVSTVTFLALYHVACHKGHRSVRLMNRSRKKGGMPDKDGIGTIQEPDRIEDTKFTDRIITLYESFFENRVAIWCPSELCSSS